MQVPENVARSRKLANTRQSAAAPRREIEHIIGTKSEQLRTTPQKNPGKANTTTAEAFSFLSIRVLLMQAPILPSSP